VLDKGISAPGQMITSCIWPENHGQRAHCPDLILYVFFAKSSKSWFLMFCLHSHQNKILLSKKLYDCAPKLALFGDMVCFIPIPFFNKEMIP
jgi:hypothetical protein